MSPAKAKRKSSTPAPGKGGGRTCAVPDCGRRVASDGLCEIHLPFLESRGELGRRMKRWLAAAGVSPSAKSTEAPEKGTSKRKPAGRGAKTKAGGARGSRKPTLRKSATSSAPADDQPAEPETQDEPSTQAFQADEEENTPTPTSDMDAAPQEPALPDEPPREEPTAQEEVPAADAEQEAKASESEAPNPAASAEEPVGEPAVSTAPVPPDLVDDEDGDDDDFDDAGDGEDDQDDAELDEQGDNDDEETPPS